MTSSVAADDFWAKFWAYAPDGDKISIGGEHIADLGYAIGGVGALSTRVDAAEMIGGKIQL